MGCRGLCVGIPGLISLTCSLTWRLQGTTGTLQEAQMMPGGKAISPPTCLRPIPPGGALSRRRAFLYSGFCLSTPPAGYIAHRRSLWEKLVFCYCMPLM